MFSRERHGVPVVLWPPLMILPPQRLKTDSGAATVCWAQGGSAFDPVESGYVVREVSARLLFEAHGLQRLAKPDEARRLS